MSDRELAGGKGPVTPDHREIDPFTGQQKGYVVLTAAERAKGFVRPVRQTYVHLGREREFEGADGKVFKKFFECGQVTRTSLDIAETYARDPKFYSGTFCIKCRDHFPLDQFVWEGTSEKVGS